MTTILSHTTKIVRAIQNCRLIYIRKYYSRATPSAEQVLNKTRTNYQYTNMESIVTR